jgi:hypothetical protein
VGGHAPVLSVDDDGLAAKYARVHRQAFDSMFIESISSVT